MAEPPKELVVAADAAGRRLDQFVVARVPDVSRARVQELIAQGKVLVNGAACKPSVKLREGQKVEIAGAAQRPPLRAVAENIPLDVVYEDVDLAVVNKPAGMMVHAGAGATEDERNRGTLVNALLYRFASLSQVGGELRPGIVHRLDRNTSGLIVVAKNDRAHRRLAAQFAGREVHKTYVALVHGWVKSDAGTVARAIGRDQVRRTRMTTRRHGGRTAVSHWRVRERIDGRYGQFTLLEVSIETGRTHQIRVHLASLGHPVVGDALYGAPRAIKAVEKQFPGPRRLLAPSGAGTRQRRQAAGKEAGQGSAKISVALARNFLHAGAIELLHPQTGAPLRLSVPLPSELQQFLEEVKAKN